MTNDKQHFIYLHGFASSPESTKAVYLRDRFAELQINLTIPDLNQGDFSHLTISRQLEQVAAELPPPPTPVTLIGSSLGGLTAAHAAQSVTPTKTIRRTTWTPKPRPTSPASRAAVNAASNTRSGRSDRRSRSRMSTNTV